MAGIKEAPSEMIEALLGNTSFAAIDLETTGFSAQKGAHIIEVGAARIDFAEGKRYQKFHSLVRPPVLRIPEKIQNLTGIRPEMVKDAPYAPIVLKKLYEFVGDRPMVFHNAMFDWNRFLQDGFASIGLRPSNPILCTKKLSQWLMPQVGYTGKYSLGDLCHYFGADIEGAHRADVDALYTVSLLGKLKAIAENSQNVTIPLSMPHKTQKYNMSQVKILRVNPWRKREEERLYIKTSVGDIYYDYLRNIWVVQRLRSGIELDMNQWEEHLIKQVGIQKLDDWLADRQPV